MKSEKSVNENLMKQLLASLGEDPNREGLADTPRRYLAFLAEFASPPSITYTTFNGEGYDEMIVQTDIPFYSLCEHHLVPFFGTGTIAYVPEDKIVGLSKLARTLEWYSRAFQNQERITLQVAERLMQELHPQGVAVILSARHMCMEMRGVRKPGTTTVTSKLTGVFKSRPETRAELLRLAKL
jgi:GTP cyclohydrolase I